MNRMILALAAAALLLGATEGNVKMDGSNVCWNLGVRPLGDKSSLVIHPDGQVEVICNLDMGGGYGVRRFKADWAETK